MSGELINVLPVAACGVVVAVAEPVTIPLLRRALIIDVPGDRSSHTVPTPRGGGIPIAAGLLVAAGLIGGAAGAIFAFAVAAFGLLGFAEDLRGLSVGRRLAIQAIGATMVTIVLVSGLAAPMVVLATLVVLGVVWITGFVNVFNFMDGVNGISGAHALLAGCVYAFLGWWQGDGFLLPAGAAVAASALAFLPWNAGRARVFLGDAGSYVLGAALAVLAAYAVVQRIPVEAALGPLVLYIADTTWTLQRRIRAGERWLEPHRTHIYQRWCDAGWTHQRVTMTAAAITVLLSLLGTVSLTGLPHLRLAADIAGAVVIAGYLRSPALLARRSRPREAAITRTVIVTHYFLPETGAPQARLSSLAAAWAADGDEVTVLTGMPSHPTGVLPPEYRRAIRRIERKDGYRIVRTWLYATPNEGLVRKTICHLSFMVTSVLLGWRALGPTDVVVVSSPTFFAIGSGWLLARIKRARLVVEIRDLWPAIFTELGVLTYRPVIRLLERLELAAYSAADTVVVVSDGFRANLIERGVPSDKVHTIRNGVCPAEFDPDAVPSQVVRTELSAARGDCLVLYAGTHGISQGLPSVADAAALLRGEAIRFAFVGEGADKRRLRDRVTELELDNVTMRSGMPHDQVPALLAAADICLVTLRDVPLFSTFIPSKIFEYLASGRAVIGALAGEAAQILREAGAVVVPPEGSVALAEAIRALAADARRREAMGRQGRRYVEEYFDRAILARHYRKLLDSAAEQR
jgi:UDP-N-acetylmuramyl pentapeptide phosphotransferase/UDP-N-acetylglucosamine-1-phosphate transferase/glycosyltransferase involved in cell wall biosynthesis